MTGKAQAARQQPSIDDLLASIRRAIHERVSPNGPGAPAGQARKPSLVHATSPASPDVAQQERERIKRTVAADQDGFAGLLGGDIRLEEALARLNQSGGSRRGASTPAAEAPRPEPRLRPTITPAPVHKPAAPARQPAAPRPAERPTQVSVPAPARSKSPDLLSTEAASAAHSAFGRLSDAVGNRSTGGESSLDELTRDCLRPLLKDWLDRNLPGIVERLVREEIEKVARRGR